MLDVKLRGRGWSTAIPAADAYGRLGVPFALAAIVASAWLAGTPVCAHALGRRNDGEAASNTRTLSLSVQRGDRLAALLAAHGLSARDIGRWVRAARPYADLGHLDPGHSLQLELDRDG